MKRTIALTGATGFIGSSVARRLAVEGWQVRVLVRPGSSRKRLAGIPVQWVEGALEDYESLCRLMRGAYAALHCAGAVRGASHTDFNRVNVDGVAHMVRAAMQQHPVPRFLLISSLAAREPCLSPYAASKRQGEQILAAASGRLFWAVFRPTAVYGPGDRELLPLFRCMERGIAPRLGTGNARLSLLYVDDLAEAVLQWLYRAKRQGGVFEIHDGYPGGYTWKDIFEIAAHVCTRRVRPLPVPVRLLEMIAEFNFAAARIFGYAPMLTPGKVREIKHLNWVADNSELSRETGWSPQVSLIEGFKRTINGAKDKGYGN